MNLARLHWGILVAALLALLLYGEPGVADDLKYRRFIEGVTEDISKLKLQFPQLQEFSPARNADTAELKISYGYRTHRAQQAGGWTSGVPNPDPDGIWFYIDLHHPDSNAQIHTQPVTGYNLKVGDKTVSFLILEGKATTPVAGEISKILSRRGAK